MELVMRLFKKGGFAIRCKTQKEADRFSEICDKMGLSYMNYAGMSSNTWDVYKEETCYVCDTISYPEDNFYVEGINIGEYDFYKNVCGLLIVDFSDIAKEDKESDALIA